MDTFERIKELKTKYKKLNLNYEAGEPMMVQIIIGSLLFLKILFGDIFCYKS